MAEGKHHLTVTVSKAGGHGIHALLPSEPAFCVLEVPVQPQQKTADAMVKKVCWGAAPVGRWQGPVGERQPLLARILVSAPPLPSPHCSQPGVTTCQWDQALEFEYEGATPTALHVEVHGRLRGGGDDLVGRGDVDLREVGAGPKRMLAGCCGLWCSQACAVLRPCRSAPPTASPLLCSVSCTGAGARDAAGGGGAAAQGGQGAGSSRAVHPAPGHA